MVVVVVVVVVVVLNLGVTRWPNMQKDSTRLWKWRRDCSRQNLISGSMCSILERDDVERCLLRRCAC